MSAYSQGDASAFDILYARHKNPTFRFVLRQCHCERSIAEELFQDLWMRVINASRFYRVAAKFTTWLYRIAHNLLVDFYRRNGRVFNISLDDEEIAIDEPASAESTQPQNLTTSQETLNILQSAIEELPIEQREAFLMQQEGGLSLAQIAEVTGCKQETIKSRIRYAIKKIRLELAEHVQ